MEQSVRNLETASLSRIWEPGDRKLVDYVFIKFILFNYTIELYFIDALNSNLSLGSFNSCLESNSRRRRSRRRRAMEEELRLLSLKDFSGLEVPSNPFQQLLMVAVVASSVHENNKNKNKNKKSKSKTKKSTETQRAPIHLQKRKRLAREKRLKKPSVPSPSLFLQQLVPSSFSLRLDPRINVSSSSSSSSSPQQHNIICSSSEYEKEEEEVMMMNAIASTDDHHLMAKKQKKNHHHGECSNSSISLRQPSTSNTTTTTSPVVHELTDRLRYRITQIGGTEIILVIQKRLSDTDVSKSHNRLSIPLRQAKAEFLTAQEKDSLGQRIGKKVNGMGVPMMVEPDLEFMTVTLKRWDMKKDTGKTSSSYVLVSEWNKIVEKNGLKKEDDIQLWSFRCNTQLCFALVQF
ncbi:B3 domain-containing protein At1g32030-like [Malania oleifera]|uniref:B3 domain-containing protein At1g32030-like n=1 Tax=Malania oleifera TaxID=397392 RepID=UPI0025AE3A15|nr:B3 domain-containing protein At1g32030-like [Malania oleifera]